MELSTCGFESEAQLQPLSKITDTFLERIRQSEGGLIGEVPNEYFDSDIRSELWLQCVGIVEKTSKEKSMSKIREIVNIDKAIYEFFITKNRRSISDTICDRILKQLAPSEAMKKRIQGYPEFTEYLEIMIKLNQLYDKIINLFRMCEFYLDIKSANSKNVMKRKSRNWDIQRLIKQLGWKTLHLFMSSTSYFINLAFKKTKLWKYLMTFAILAFIQNNPAGYFYFLQYDISISSLTLPLFGKALQWCGLFDKISEIINTKEAILYINSLMNSTKETYTILRKYYELVLKDFEEILEKDDGDLDECNLKLEEKLKLLDKDFSEIEKFIDQELFVDIEVEELEDGWMILTDKNALQLKLSQPEDFSRNF